MKKAIQNTRLAIAAALMLLGANLVKAQALAVSITSVTNASCFGLCDGSLTATPTGGAGLYTYSWAPGGMTTQTINGLCAGTYTVTVTDAVAATATVSATIVQPTQLTIGSANTSICQGNNASLCPSVSGGTPGYTFIWSPSATLNNPNLGCPVSSATVTTTYTITVTDAQGCVGNGVTTVTVNPLPNPVATNNGPVCAGSNILFGGSYGGGMTWMWVGPNGFTSTQQNPQIISAVPMNAGTYTCTVTDANGCSGSTNTTVAISLNPIASITAHVEPGCGNSDGSLTGVASGGSGGGPYTYLWSNATTTPFIGILPTGVYTLTVTDMFGCIGQASYHLLDSCEVVWPGDADNDLTADNNDILDIGLYYGETGIPRLAATTNWVGQPAENFTTTKTNGFNAKHDDCNGDGLVDASDTTAVILNYNFTHPAYKLLAHTNAGPELALHFVLDSIGNSSKATMNISLGTAANPVNNVYGIALTVSIDTTIVKRDSTSMIVSGSWLAAGCPVFLNNVIENYNNSEIDLVMCRTNHSNVSGYGDIGNVDFTMKDDISGKMMSTYVKTLQSSIVKYKLISTNGDTLGLTTSGDSIKVSMLATEVSHNAAPAIVGAHPNPVKDLLTINSNYTVSKVELYSYTGQLVTVAENASASKSITVNTSDLSTGIYLAKVYSAQGIKVIRIQVE